MLQEKAIDPHTLELIRTLQKDPELTGFHLAGGTALALYLGHRQSVDIDLFTTKEFDSLRLLEHLEKEYGFSMHLRDKNTLKGIVSGVMTDLLTHSYPTVKSIHIAGGISMYSMEDIAAMKVNAVSGDGTRIKDFIDIYFLLDRFTLKEIISFYRQKYGSRNELHALKSLGYFDDLPETPDWPVMLKEKDLTLERIKEKLTRSILEYFA